MTPDELTRLREEVARLRAAIAPTDENVEFVAGFFDRYCTDDDGVTGWLDSCAPSTALLRALSERAGLNDSARRIERPLVGDALSSPTVPPAADGQEAGTIPTVLVAINERARL